MSKEIVQQNEQVIRTELKELVRQRVEEVLNGMLDAQADRLTNARKCERTEGRQDTRAGQYPGKLLTTAGEIDLEVPKLRTLTFETPSSKGTSSEKPALKKPWLRSIWQGCPPGILKISPVCCGMLGTEDILEHATFGG